MKGILLLNIGSPSGYSKKEILKFINYQMSDPYCFSKSSWISHFIEKNISSQRLSLSQYIEKYETIWRKEEPYDSPLHYNMKRMAVSLEQKKNIPVEIGMRYGSPSIEEGFQNLEKKCPLLHEVIVIPLFAHYAFSTVQTTIDEVGKVFYSRPRSFRLKILKPYFDHPAYISALSKHAAPFLKDIDRLIFAYNSMPLDRVETAWKKGRDFDYVYQVKETNQLFCEKLNIEPQQTFLFYLSEHGNNWLKPFLNTEISEMPKLGWKKIAVIAPGISADKTETLYDIDIKARSAFMKAGGQKFTFIPSFNDSDYWIEALWKMAQGV